MFNFDFSNGYVILRIICGLFFIPHAIGKITQREGVLGFFNAAGMKPAPLFAGVSMAVEWVVSICLILGIFTPYAACAAAGFLAVAFVAVLKVSQRKWLWNLGGAEYPLFWGICCVIVALHAP
jgi:putative oxidoreductase